MFAFENLGFFIVSTTPVPVKWRLIFFLSSIFAFLNNETSLYLKSYNNKSACTEKHRKR